MKFSRIASKNLQYALAKSSCVLCFRRDEDDDDHGVRRANTAGALARWRHLGALHEATDTLHRAMCLAPYCPIGMVITFVVDYVTFYYIVNNRVAIN
jgi:hypothetical protein